MNDHDANSLPSQVDLKLRIGIFRLLNAKYQLSWGDQTKFLCAAILNSIVLEPPGNEDARTFLGAHKEVIEKEALTLHLDNRLSTAIALLYTLTLVRLGPKDPERTFGLATRATELTIIIPSTNDVCEPRGGSVKENAMEFLSVIDQYASELLRC